MHTKNSGRFAVDEDFLQFRTAPKMMMDRKRNWAENETDLRTKIPKTKLVRNWQICTFGTKTKTKFGRSLGVGLNFATSRNAHTQLFWDKVRLDTQDGECIGAFRRKSTPYVSNGYWPEPAAAFAKGEERSSEQD